MVSIYQAFYNQVNKVPDKTAVRQGDKKLTYRQLYREVGQLASYLHQNRGRAWGASGGVSARIH